MKVKLIKSRFGRNPKHQRILKALGLRKIGQVKEFPDHPSVTGMLHEVRYLLEIVEE